MREAKGMGYSVWRRSMICCLFWTLKSILLLDNCSSVLATTSGGTYPEDVTTLKQIQAAWGNPFALLDWVGNDPCSEGWYGVECDSSSPQFVISLWLSESRLYGRIPEKLGNLRHLRSLLLSTNGIGGEIPASLGNLTALVKLELDQNRLQGNLPNSLAALQQLTFLNLSGNENLTGRLPGRLATVQNLSYDANRICVKSTDAACAHVPPAPAALSPIVAPTLAPTPARSQGPTQPPLSTATPPSNLAPPPAGKPPSPPSVIAVPPLSPAPMVAPNVAPTPSLAAVPSPTLRAAPSPAPSNVIPPVTDSLSPCGGAVADRWECLCDGGARGSQTCPGDGAFLEACKCNGDCLPCPFGMVTREGLAADCVCARPVVLRARLLNLSFHSFTPSMESAFLTNLADTLKLNRNQLFAVKRISGSVIVDILVTPFGNLEDTLDPTTLDRIRIAVAGALFDPLFGPFDVLILDDGLTQHYFSTTPSTRSPTPLVSPPTKKTGSKLLLPTFIICLTATLLAIISAIVCILNERKRGIRRYPKGMYRDESLFQRLTSNSISLSGEAVPTPGGVLGNDTSENAPGTKARVFSYFELDEATSGFDRRNLIGVGGSSSVFRGRLPGNQIVAVKLLLCQRAARFLMDFLKEVEILSRLHHVNLVTLIGYSMDGNERILVYEYMRNGTLREHLSHSVRHRKSLTWEQRVRIALGAARGLEYLHEAANPRILHRDFKSTNILLDDKLRAKVADFGMAKEDLTGSAGPSSPALTQVLGTFGYFAPEYSLMGKASTKSDIFSFGVVLLELMTGRQAVDMSRPEGQESLVLWAYPLLLQEASVISQLPDPRLKNKFPPSSMIRMGHIAWACLQAEPEKRPGMTEVVAHLKALLPRQRTALRSLSFSTWASNENRPSLGSMVVEEMWSPPGILAEGGRGGGQAGECSKWAEERGKGRQCSTCARDMDNENSPSQSPDPLDSQGSPFQGSLSLSFGCSPPLPPGRSPPVFLAPASPGQYADENCNSFRQEDVDRSSEGNNSRLNLQGGMYLVPL